MKRRRSAAPPPACAAVAEEGQVDWPTYLIFPLIHMRFKSHRRPSLGGGLLLHSRPGQPVDSRHTGHAGPKRAAPAPGASRRRAGACGRACGLPARRPAAAAVRAGVLCCSPSDATPPAV